MNISQQLTSNLPVGAYKLVELYLQESIFRCSPRQYQELELNFDVKISFSEIENTIHVVLKVILSTAKPDIFHLEASMQGKFERQDETVTMAVEEFSNIIAASIMFPYIREHVSSLTSKSGINPITLPIINFIQLYHEAKKQN